MKVNVLFVDDEPNVLQGLKRMLRPMKEEWHMEFARGGEEALDILKGETTFDVVVTDMRMPEMDGVRLLTKVMERYPDIVRIILSGESDDKNLLSSVRVAHQFLSKPCDPDSLKTVISRACELCQLLADDKLKKKISRMSTIPSIPSVYAELMEVLNQKDGQIQKAGEIIACDMAMTAKILQLVNSAFFGLRRNVSNPMEAAIYLGIDTLKSLVLSIQVFSQFKNKKISGMFIKHLWKHSLATGISARDMAKENNLNQNNVDYSFTSGLLHDLGKLVLAANFPEKYNQVIFAVYKKNVSYMEAESNAFNITHPEVGAYLMALWGLPGPVVEAIAFHHRKDSEVQKQFSALEAVYRANILEHEEYNDKPEA